ncbi:hypothetical protein Ctu_3p00250 (plasmid) [Cronobacter turicensis z3032]|uniref:Uncharacterized protein n=1 Tax=Cronobacter turicensis (strain DSM 18703 / CCUG 55852 / LMG 23827 / z3032) TaxID=693216 RepID=C9Y5T5_CROTZ|nr:hypothetical protein Ctu_3p00250 [Cronobacter turicensis z3032]
MLILRDKSEFAARKINGKGIYTSAGMHRADILELGAELYLHCLSQ